MSNELIQQVHLLEQNLQQILLQKQAFLLEISETESALNEIDSSKEVFKIIGNLMIKTEKEKTKEDLQNKLKILELRIKNFDKQEELLNEKLQSLRKNLINKKKKPN